MATTLRNEKQPAVWHVLGHALEKIMLQIRRVAVLQVSAFVTGIEEIPIAGADVSTPSPSKAHACFGHPTALLPNLFALLLREACQEGIKTRKTQRRFAPRLARIGG